MKITKIEIQKKNLKRYNLYIDGDFKMGIHEDVIVSLGLYVNMVIDEATVEDILLKEVYAKAKADALNYISYRMRSESEVKSKLYELGNTEDMVNVTIDFLYEYGYLNDYEFTKSFIHDKATLSRHSLYRIKHDLKLKGVSSKVIEKAINYYKDQMIDFDYDNAKVLALKKYKQLLSKKKYSEYELKQRVYQALSQKGFNIYTVKDALEDALNEEPID
ncbi:hypothetical protein EZV73_19295 [Acidaminobacter sp. JC074]|uniref:RecX family transcriptional regulator n=1 Tax=Acidaminobacter sp. JC074 TaxID=2530199 RepID=UPI001F0F3EDB|nr:RecX family transcriptional regulator [Acidaminobacter sp. JC074]MCH4889737.1 hypothetical protein [Acidaminobacter sp. JC074]